MIPILMHLGDGGAPLYYVNVEPALAIPIAYFIALLVCVLLREFTQGLIRYVLAGLFIASFSALWFILMLDYSPWNIIMVVVIIFGGVSGLWDWIRDILKDFKKL